MYSTLIFCCISVHSLWFLLPDWQLREKIPFCPVQFHKWLGPLVTLKPIRVEKVTVLTIRKD